MADAANRPPPRVPDGLAAGDPSGSAAGLQRALAVKVRGYDARADTTLLDDAFAVAARAHAQQTRDNGEPYITHPLAVADILAGYRLDTATIATALLHDVIEDTAVKLPELERRVGPAAHDGGEAAGAVARVLRVVFQADRREQPVQVHHRDRVARGGRIAVAQRCAGRVHGIAEPCHVEARRARRAVGAAVEGRQVQDVPPPWARPWPGGRTNRAARRTGPYRRRGRSPAAEQQGVQPRAEARVAGAGRPGRDGLDPARGDLGQADPALAGRQVGQRLGRRVLPRCGQGQRAGRRVRVGPRRHVAHAHALPDVLPTRKRIRFESSHGLTLWGLPPGARAIRVAAPRIPAYSCIRRGFPRWTGLRALRIWRP